MQKKVALITSIYGGKDNLRNIPKEDGIDYFFFSNEKQDAKPWEFRFFPSGSSRYHFTARMDAKRFKVLPFIFLPEYEYFIWCDGNHIPQEGKLNKLVQELDESGREIAVFRHCERSCVYDEANVCALFGADFKEILQKTVDFLAWSGYPRNNGLYEMPCFIFKNTDNMKNLMLLWWEMINAFSSRDQITFPYCLWKLKIEPHILEGQVNKGTNEYFIDLGAHNF